MTIERTIFFNGMIYQVEEEVYSDPDHSSVYTSEDSFESERGLQREFAHKNPLKAITETSDAFKRQSRGSSFKSPSKLLNQLGEKAGPRDTEKSDSDSHSLRNSRKNSFHDTLKSSLIETKKEGNFT